MLSASAIVGMIIAVVLNIGLLGWICVKVFKNNESFDD